jgi:beta-lactam-binding protein with PASTA domain
MPGLVGLDQADADRILTSTGIRGFKTSSVAQTGSAASPSGKIVSQMPARGAQITPDTQVELGVAQ